MGFSRTETTASGEMSQSANIGSASEPEGHQQQQPQRPDRVSRSHKTSTSPLFSVCHFYGVVVILAICICGVICQETAGGGGGGAENTLTIVPTSKNRVYQRALGKSAIFTCTANVEVPERLTEFKWWWPDGRAIEATDSRVEIMRDQPGTLTLLFTSIQEPDLGTYRCTALYANTQQLETDFTLRAYVPITFEDAPINQYAVKGQDYKVKCRVRADPEPQVDWKKDHRVINNSVMISTHSQLIPPKPSGSDPSLSNDSYSDHFVMDKDGVVIRGVTEADEGVYTCRVRVTSMGTVEERHIQVEVHEHPVLTSEPVEVEGVEDESVTLQCSATGKPPPEYEWVNHRHQDLRVLERHTVDKYKGTLQIDGIKREDAGVYTCTARNTAGYVTMKSTLNVVTKPVIEEFKNITTQVNGNGVLVCRASGDPAPDIKFQKDSLRSPFTLGVQHDPRIRVEQKKQGRMTVATLHISDILRTDDGLYNCLAFNQRTQTERLGHITVEFPPTFTNTPMTEAWSWDGRPVNMSCLAEGIPNATITWFIEGTPEREVDNSMQNIKQIGYQSLSSLEIRPIDRGLFGFYKCKATNKLGVAEHKIQLREARKPGPILEAIVQEKTATSISYKIVGPVDTGGLPIKNFVAQYKEDRATWDDHRLKSWPVDQQIFAIEGLEPMRTYNVRFAAENEVGVGNWAQEKVETTPRRSAPETPVIQNEINGNSAAINAYPDKFELIWKVPPDNGERIQAFDISYTPVKNLTVTKGSGGGMEYELQPVGQKLVVERPLGEPRYVLRNLAPGTFYKVEIRARNAIGSSAPATIIIKTAAIPGGSSNQGSYDLIKGESNPVDNLPMMILILVAGVLVIIFLVDISCYRINQTGIIWMISNRMCNKKKSRESLVKDATIQEKRPLNSGSDPADDPSREYEQIGGPKSNGNGTNNGNGASITITPSHITHTHHHHPKDSEV